MNDDYKKFKDLLGSNADKFAEDLKFTDKLFASNPAPGPDANVLDDICVRLAGVGTGWRYARRLTAVAAMFAVVTAVVWYGLFAGETKPTQAIYLTSAVWESYDLTDDDPALYAAVNEIEEIESYDKDWGNGQLADSLNDIELELDENNSLWKG